MSDAPITNPLIRSFRSTWVGQMTEMTDLPGKTWEECFDTILRLGRANGREVANTTNHERTMAALDEIQEAIEESNQPGLRLVVAKAAGVVRTAHPTEIMNAVVPQWWSALVEALRAVGEEV